ncbi:phosphohistidine phosphatase SixA [Leptothoe sp. PORK10 BA2]|uniref:phosphohistidine phosphatase SixA n=1 Tax=Leptothoe sp. PORK10 BA2 TaxID=3110254 RepID=UPI002B1F19E9|nr:phosphohistidine phosphatase SixA [Leptothoe sp. PORK10 BA2]MEA5462186.1 phosphohistidine phosphatase SixA [Leptothoe sp. PORK10 BA2]
MQIYFIRHGIAADRGSYGEDEQRPLIPKGIHKTQQVAQRLSQLGISFDTLLTSPLMRAVQTADIFCQANLAADYHIFQPLAPAGNIQAWLDWLTNWRGLGHDTLALVGHEPDLSQWCQQLVQGSIDDRWILKKAGIIGVTVPRTANPIGQSQLFWLAPPRLML